MNDVRVKVTRHGDRKFFIMYYDDPITGKRVQKSTKTESRREAEKSAGKWEQDLQEERYIPTSKITWAEFRERYEDQKLVHDSKSMFIASATAFNHLEAMINPDRLCKLTTPIITRFKLKLSETGMSENSVTTQLAHLRCALNWAAEQGLMVKAPKFSMPKRKRKQRKARGGSINAEQFDRMQDATAKVVQKGVNLWKRYLEGLWLSGLRLEESLKLSWDQDSPFRIDMDGKYPKLRIATGEQKSGEKATLPLTPDFAEFLQRIPVEERHGYVFGMVNPQTGRPRNKDAVGRTISAIGRKAGVLTTAGTTPTAHDLRRSFGTRWARKVKTVTLQLLMRHDDIKTTLEYYVDQDADAVAADLWRQHVGTSVGTNKKSAHSTANPVAPSGDYVVD